MKEKMLEAVAKIRVMDIFPSTAYMFYNMYLCKKVYFGCGIISINDKQEEELMKIYEPVILKKLGLGEKFPRLCLYSKRSSLGIGLMKPKIILAILALKLYIGHKRIRSNISRKISINEQMQFLQDRYNSHPISTPVDDKIEIKTWIDEIGEIMKKRDLEFSNNDFDKCAITRNKTIMSYAVEYVNEKNLKKEILAPINQVRISKKMYLPCEILGLRGTEITKAGAQIKETSSIVWKFEFEKVLQLSKKTKEVWEDYLEWLKVKNVQTILDFTNHCNTKLCITEDKKYACEINDGVKTCYEKQFQRYGRERYVRIDYCLIVKWNGMIGHISSNGELKCQGVIREVLPNSTVNYEP